MKNFTKEEQITISHFSEKQQRIFESQRQRSGARQAFNLAIMCDEKFGKASLKQEKVQFLGLSKVTTIETSAKIEMRRQGIFTFETVQDALTQQGIPTGRGYLSEIARKLKKEGFIRNRGKVRHGRHQFEWIGGEPKLRYLIPFEEYAKHLKFFQTKELYSAVRQDFADCTIGQCRISINNMLKSGVLVSLKKDGLVNTWRYQKCS